MLECAIMALIGKAPGLSPILKAALDAFLLFILVYPLTIMLMYRPLKKLLTEQKKTSSEIAALNAEMESIFDSVASALIVSNRDFIVEKINKKGAMIFNCDVDTACGSYCGDAIGCSKISTIKNNNDNDVCKNCALRLIVDNTFTTGVSVKPVEITLRIDNRNMNRPVHFLASTSLIHIENERKVLLCLENITSIKESMEKLAESEDRFRLLFENTRDAIFWADAETGVIINCNQSAAKLLERDKKDIIGQHQTMLHPPEKLDYFIEMFRQHSMDKGAVNAEAEVITASGKIVPVHISSSITTIGSEKINQGIFIDDTERRRVEKDRVEKEKFTAIGRVAGKIAHDFNNNLAIISSAASLLGNATEKQKANDYIRMILDCARSGQKMTRNLILYAKDREPHFVEFDINDRIHLITMSLEKELEGIALEFNAGAGLDKFVADPDIVVDSITNLIINAIHAVSLSSAPKLTISTRKIEEHIEIEVSDNGCGIPLEVKDVIFEPAFTMKGSNDDRRMYDPSIKGSGYGLANVKRCMEKHFGTVSLESEVGKGTSFLLTFPEIPPMKEVEQADIRSIPEHDHIDGCKVLLVEDEANLSRLMQDLLIANKFNVDVAMNAAQAFEKLGSNCYEVISLDYMLPDRPGTDVYEFIRKNNKDIPIVFVSGNLEFIHSVEELKKADKKLVHLQKPFENSDYLNKLRSLLSKRSERRGKSS